MPEGRRFAWRRMTIMRYHQRSLALCRRACIGQPGLEIIQTREIEQRLAQIQKVFGAQSEHVMLHRLRQWAAPPRQLAQHDFLERLVTSLLDPLGERKLLNTGHKRVHLGLLLFNQAHCSTNRRVHAGVEAQHLIEHTIESAHIGGPVAVAEEGAKAGQFAPQPLRRLPPGGLRVAVDQNDHRDRIAAGFEHRQVKVEQFDRGKVEPHHAPGLGVAKRARVPPRLVVAQDGEANHGAAFADKDLGVPRAKRMLLVLPHEGGERYGGTRRREDAKRD